MEEFVLVVLPILFFIMLVVGIVLIVLSRKKPPDQKRPFKIVGIVCTVVGALGLVVCALLWYLMFSLLGIFTDWIGNNFRGLG